MAKARESIGLLKGKLGLVSSESGTKVVDLSHRLDGEVRPYPGQPVPKFDSVTSISLDGYLISEIHSRSHMGTHADAPAHFIEDGRTTYDIGIDEWMGEAWIVNIDGSSVKRIESHMLDLPTEPCRVLLISTGHSTLWGTDRYYEEAPYLSEEASKSIRDAGVRLLGLDFPSADAINDPAVPCHRVLLEAGVLMIENLANLEQIKGQYPWFCAAPIMLGGGDGGFCRAFAIC
jgi:kynurenine formamidase